jgi:hypothetical protein
VFTLAMLFAITSIASRSADNADAETSIEVYSPKASYAPEWLA